MKKRTAILTATGALFIATNVFLTLHNDSKVSRTNFLTSWFEAKAETLTETLQTAGVVTPTEEHPIYFNGEEGGFQQFYVQKGDSVTAGTPLYEYKSAQVDADRQRLETEIKQLNREVALIEDQVQQLEYLQTVSAGSSSDSVAVSGDGLVTPVPGLKLETLVEVTIEKEIYDKEREIRNLEKEIEVHEDNLAALERNNELDVRSQVNGTVKEINLDLKNPIMTIISDDPKVQGTFTEKDLANVTEGMEAYITSDLIQDKLAGKLTKIASHSKEDPDVSKESEFSFEIELDPQPASDSETLVASTEEMDEAEEMVADSEGTELEDPWELADEDLADTSRDSQPINDGDDLQPNKGEPNLVHGQHVDITIITDQRVGAVTVADEQIQNGSYLYVLTRTGKVERRFINMGLEVDDRIEIIDGLQVGETVVENAERVAKPNAPFITRLDLLRLNLKLLKDGEPMDWVKAIGVGFSKQ
ncbi:efflux RND transporter periplasmic adaptor subunit [Mesobacillus maritimus]|uniref:efflux RND transporter periplasmic adaptor subunit n=1 Tax=Mesobacillus maritimus TaxID=1643336 RepID=UPI00384D052D